MSTRSSRHASQSNRAAAGGSTGPAAGAAESFETYRSYLFAIAYRMLGSAMDAEDMVQETYLRYQSTPPESIVSLKAFLATILVRLCLGQLHLAYRDRETYLGPWLPEPIYTASTDERVEADETLSLAFLVLLEQLQPVERVVFLLREVFDYDYPEIAALLDKSEVACRQWFSRAKKHLTEDRPRYRAAPEVQRRLLAEFLHAAQAGEMASLMDLLSEDVVLWADGGGKIKGAATHPIRGRAEVAQFTLGVTRRFFETGNRAEIVEVNSQPALLFRTRDRVFFVLTIDAEGGRIHALRGVANPDKLGHV